MNCPPYKKILLKISGESLMGERSFGLDQEMLTGIAREIVAVRQRGVSLSLVVGGGNIFRGLAAASCGVGRTTADYMGMLGTVMNALALQSVLERAGVDTRVLSAIPMQSVCEPYVRRRALRHMEKDRVVICAAGTGNPFFTTDTAAALRAVEMGCDALFKGTKVDGVYDVDPALNPDAVHSAHVSYTEALTRGVGVMDAAALALSRDNKMPIIVFNIRRQGNFLGVLDGRERCTLVSGS